jgi:hypothetical protein
VSSNRNFSVGDSTWPSQKTTLAWLSDKGILSDDL